MIRKDIDIDVRNDQGMTALEVAIHFDRAAKADHLLGSGAACRLEEY